MERDLGIPSSLIAPPVTGSVVALAKSQVGFMNLFAIPLFENLSKVLPEMGFSVGALNANRDSWSKKIDLYAAQAAAAAAEERLAAGAKNTSPSRHLSFNNGAGSSNHPTVLGTALMDSDMPNSDASMSGSDIRSGFASPRSLDSRTAMQHAHSGNGNATTTNTSVTLVVTHPNKPPARTKGYGPVSKRPTYQHSTEHLRAGVSETSSPDRPRSSPPDLGDCSDHSCSKGCCGTAVVANGTMERRSSRFFKKVKLWKGWRKEPSDG